MAIIQQIMIFNSQIIMEIQKKDLMEEDVQQMRNKKKAMKV